MGFNSGFKGLNYVHKDTIIFTWLYISHYIRSNLYKTLEDMRSIFNTWDGYPVVLMSMDLTSQSLYYLT